MNTFLRNSRIFAVIFFIANMFLANGILGQILISDQADYAPGSTATLTGTGFEPGEQVKLQVLHADETPDTGEDHGTWYVTADGNGDFVTTWHVCEDDCLGSTLRATAYGQSSGLTADVVFTDANSVKFAVSGLPSNAYITVTGINYLSTGGPGGTLVVGASETFSGNTTSGNLGVVGGDITFIFPTTVTYLGAIYQLFSTTQTSPFTPPNGSTIITGTYIGCTAPTIITQPESQTVIYGTDASFSVSATGTDLTYQWQVSTDGGLNFINVANGGVYSNATTANLTLIKPTVAMSGNKYRCVITSTCGNVTTNNIDDTGVMDAILTVNKKGITGSFTASNKDYDGNTSATVTGYSVATKIGSEDVNISGGTATFDTKDQGTGKTVTLVGATLTGADKDNYSLSSVNTATANIYKRLIIITANINQFKYCGQVDPVFTYTSSEPLIAGATYSGALGRLIEVNNDGSYNYTLGDLSAGMNFTLSLNTLNPTFTIKAVSIDANASSTPLPVDGVGTVSTVLSASVTPAVSDIQVMFYVNGVAQPSVMTINGIATVNVNSLVVGVYKIEAVVGTGCSTSTVYLPVYDPNGGFVTGGGWINSPYGALVGTTITGKANFGFVAKYKTGKNNANEVDGNTNFQFKEGDFNFKSSSHDDMSLVISGEKKATYRGVGTVNGLGIHKFMVTVIDGNVAGGDGIDRFRIRIFADGSTSNVIYDNEYISAENADATTAIGGGSIVIHKPTKGKNAKMVFDEKAIIIDETNDTDSQFNVIVHPNPSASQFSATVEGSSIEKVQVLVFDVLGRLLKTIEKKDGETIQFGEDLPMGTYIAKISQGVESKSVQLIKQ